jgi:hypothetical protein
MRSEKCLLQGAVGEESFHIRGQKRASDAGVLTADRESSNDRACEDRRRRAARRRTLATALKSHLSVTGHTPRPAEAIQGALAGENAPHARAQPLD